MKKLLILVALGAVLLAACGGSSNAVAATVNGHEVTVGDVESLIDSGGEPVSKDRFAQILGYQIQWLIINDAAEADYGVSVTDDDQVAAEEDVIVNDLAQDGQSRDEFLAASQVTEKFLNLIARQNLTDEALRATAAEDVPQPTEEEIDAARTDAKEAQTTVCVSHILVETQEEADDVLARLADGEEFGQLATELSLDTQSAANNGILPCGSPDGYVGPFRDATLVAPVGEVYDQVIETQYGFHVILVTDRTEPKPEDLPTEEELIQSIREQTALDELQDWFLGVSDAADVTVEAEYGTWTPNPPTVNPPAG